MRKKHLLVVVDEELNVQQTACGLAVTPARPLTDDPEEITCNACRVVWNAFMEHEKEKRKRHRTKKEQEP